MASGPLTDSSGRIRPSQNGQGAGPAGPAAPQAQAGAGPAVQRPQREKKGLAQIVESPDFERALKQALPKMLTPAKMVRVILTALRATRDLALCTPESFFACVMQAAQLGLECNTPNGHAYLIPRRNGKTGQLDCTLIVGYQGMIELALRSGKVEKIWTRTVREGDHFKVKYGLQEDIEHEPAIDADREKRPITYVYAVAKLTTGGTVFEVLSSAQVEARKARSAASRSGPWQTDTEAMVRKTAVRSLFKWVPKSSEMALADSLDERDEEGRPQQFDGGVYDAMEGLGMAPIDTYAEDVDPQTGEVNAQAEPGSNG